MSISLEVLEKVKAEVTAKIEELKKKQDWNIESINGKIDALQVVVTEVEKVAKEIGGMSGEDKKKLAVDIINKLVDIPILPEFVEAQIISFVIDLIITAINKWFGHSWVEKLPN